MIMTTLLLILREPLLTPSKKLDGLKQWIFGFDDTRHPITFTTYVVNFVK
jgi:hypothetical protein